MSGAASSQMLSSIAGTSVRSCSSAACSASSTPLTVSWSVSANNLTPAAAAAATTSRGASSPSEWMECDWRSKVGGMADSLTHSAQRSDPAQVAARVERRHQMLT